MKTYLFSILLLVACSEKKAETVLSPKDFAASYQATANAILLDVRTLKEVDTGTIANAKNIVYDDVFVSKIDTLSHKPLFVYCASGKRSAKAAKILRDKGYEPVYELSGGLNAWKEAGLPIK